MSSTSTTMMSSASARESIRLKDWKGNMTDYLRYVADQEKTRTETKTSANWVEEALQFLGLHQGMFYHSILGFKVGTWDLIEGTPLFEMDEKFQEHLEIIPRESERMIYWDVISPHPGGMGVSPGMFNWLFKDVKVASTKNAKTFGFAIWVSTGKISIKNVTDLNLDENHFAKDLAECFDRHIVNRKFLALNREWRTVFGDLIDEYGTHFCSSVEVGGYIKVTGTCKDDKELSRIREGFLKGAFDGFVNFIRTDYKLANNVVVTASPGLPKTDIGSVPTESALRAWKAAIMEGKAIHAIPPTQVWTSVKRLLHQYGTAEFRDDFAKACDLYMAKGRLVRDP